MRPSYLIVFPVFSFFAGCGSAASDPSGTDGAGGAEEAGLGGAASVNLRGPCEPGTRLGAFTIAANQDLDYGYLDGTVKNGIDPGAILELLLEDDTCRLLRRPLYVCETACDSTETCNSDLECQALARAQDLGTVTLRGLEQIITLEAAQPGNAYFGDVPSPPLAAGRVTSLTTDASGYAGEVELFGIGVDALSLINARFVLNSGASLSIRWDPKQTAEVPSELFLSLSIDQHGATPALLSCRFPDTGEASGSAEMVDGLLAAGITGYPSAQLARRTVDHAELADGCFEFIVGSERAPDLAITGYTPCSAPSDCPNGQSCNTALERCE